MVLFFGSGKTASQLILIITFFLKPKIFETTNSGSCVRPAANMFVM